MYRNPEKFEQKIIKLCQANKLTEIYEYIRSIAEKRKRYNDPDYLMLEALGKLDISAKDKRNLIDQVKKIYQPSTHSDFDEIISYALSFDREVDIPLILKHGNPDLIVAGEYILVYLFEKGRFDLLDALIDKFSSSILNSVFELRYYDKNREDVISYILKRRKKPQRSNIPLEVSKVILYGENCTRYTIEDLSGVKINDVSVAEFAESNEQFIQSVSVVRNKQFREEGHHDDSKPLFIQYNICLLDIELAGGKRLEYKIKWLSDCWYGSDFLQRCYKKNGKYIWSYDNRHISKNYFSLEAFEEKIKHINNFDYNHKIQADDMLPIKNTWLTVGASSTFESIEKIIDDLEKLTKLKKLSIRFSGYFDTDDICVCDVSDLCRLKEVKKIVLSIYEGQVKLVGIEKLARKGIVVIVDGCYLDRVRDIVDDPDNVFEVFKKNRAKIKFIR